MKNKAIVFAYISSNVVANLCVITYGQVALPFTAFFLVPFDLASRDYLHEAWRGNVFTKMTLMILSASALTFLVNQQAENVALASTVAFFSSAVVDALVYNLLRHMAPIVKMNASNVASAACDSVIFPLIAFSSVNTSLAFTQMAMKFAGGAFWSLIILRLFSRHQ